jgi:hypothetical protein
LPASDAHAKSATSVERATETVTGSRVADTIVFVALALLSIGAARGIRVYHSVTLAEVTLVRVAADGRRETLPTPDAIAGLGGISPPRNILRRARAQIRAHVRSRGLGADDPPGTRYEWVVRYGGAATSLHNRRTIVVTPRRRDG